MHLLTFLFHYLGDTKTTRTAAQLKPRYKKHGYSHCPTPSNAKYKESKCL